MDDEKMCCANCKWCDWVDRPQLVYEKEILTYCNFLGNVTDESAWCVWYVPQDESGSM